MKYKLLKSALINKDLEKIIEWTKKQKETVNVKIRKVNFSKMEKWIFDEERGNLRHESGQFFSIDGIRVTTTIGGIKSWDQPIINQPEIGYLGIIAKEIDGILHLLLQAKIEPGNINYVQLSPTLQATRSNYLQIHKGKKPRYLEYFQKASKNQIILDQLQSEQGARFLKKRNRNIIIKVEEDIELDSNYIWLTIGQIKALMQMDNIVNMDTRTVIAGIEYGDYTTGIIDLLSSVLSGGKSEQKMMDSLLNSSDSYNSNVQIISKIAEIKSSNQLHLEKIPLIDLKDWEINETEIKRADDRYFKVIGLEVEISNREVAKWYQPMIQPAQEGICAFLCREINERLHFAVQIKMECGNYDIIELAPTVQTLTGDYRDGIESIPFLKYMLNVTKNQVFLDSYQSEEGGRFYKEQNRNLIVIGGEEIPIDLPSNFIWMTLNQIITLIQHSNYFNIQARNLVASINLA